MKYPIKILLQKKDNSLMLFLFLLVHSLDTILTIICCTSVSFLGNHGNDAQWIYIFKED